MSRQEKVVHAGLMEDGYESYLPLQRTKRKWSDRIEIVPAHRKEKTLNPHRPNRLFDDCEYAGNLFRINIDRKNYTITGRISTQIMYICRKY
jgi:hypothetical protein